MELKHTRLFLVVQAALAVTLTRVSHVGGGDWKGVTLSALIQSRVTLSNLYANFYARRYKNSGPGNKVASWTPLSTALIGQYNSIETSQRWRTNGDTVSNVTSPVIEPKICHNDNAIPNHCAN